MEKKYTVSFSTIILAAFVFCKLAGLTAIAKWSWLWVLSPIWIPSAIALSILVIAIAIKLLVDYIEYKQEQDRITKFKSKLK